MIRNPELKGFPKIPLEFDNHGSRGFIEWPDEWTWVQREKEGHPPPESYHRDNGYEISAGSREWEAGYGQTVEVKRGQYYRLRAIFNPAMYRYDTNPIDPTWMAWRWEVRADKLEIDSEWESVAVEELKKDHEHHLVFKSPVTGVVTIAFVGRGAAWDYIYKMHVHRLEMEAVDRSAARHVVVTPPVDEGITSQADGWRSAVASPVGGQVFAHVRGAPTLTSEPPVGRIVPGTPLEVLATGATADPDGTPYRWLPVRTSKLQGWVREDMVVLRAESDAGEPVARVEHPVRFTFYGSEEEAMALRDAIARDPDGFSVYAARFLSRD